VRIRITGGAPLRGAVAVPGDKSISHRALILAAIADGRSRLEGVPAAGDVDRTIAGLRALGVGIERHGPAVVVEGVGLRGLRAAASPIDCGNSGTTLRLFAGLLAGRPFQSELRGDASLCARPMRRIVDPLRRMGAGIEGVLDAGGEIHAPLRVGGGRLEAVHHDLPVASAQVKSALLLAGLRARGTTSLTEPGQSRDHTERLLARMGAPVRLEAGRLGVDTSEWNGRLTPLQCSVPGDVSSAAFLCVGGVALPGSVITIRSVGLNPTRTGFLDVLVAMGAGIRVEPSPEHDEPRGDLVVRASTLAGTEVRGSLALRSLDEIPVLAVAATRAHGVTTFGDLAELRVKESDRIAAMTASLRAMGAGVVERGDGLTVRGPASLHGTSLALDQIRRDHRVFMSLAIASLCASGSTWLEGPDTAEVSFPGFVSTLRDLGAELTSVDAT